VEGVDQEKMNTQAEAPAQTEATKPAKRVVSGEAVLGYAVFGSLLTGIIGIARGGTAPDAVGAAACLLASVLAFATVSYIYIRKS
jgi:hypothetical protein